MTILSLLNVTAERGEKILFRNVSFTAPAGSFWQVNGANGSGKTTLLKIAAGLLSPLAGEVSWNGETIRRNDDYRKNMLYIGHENALLSHVTVRENIEFWCGVYGTEMLRDVAIHYFGLATRAEMKCGELSAGWRRRVALSRLVVAPKTTCWLLDEPLTNLDEEATAKTYALMTGKVNQGGVILATSHHPLEIKPCQRLSLNDWGAA